MSTVEQPDPPLPRWDAQLLAQLQAELQNIRAAAIQLERDFQAQLQNADAAYQSSARNLLHYLALRRHDIRQLQEQLAGLGLSSLGRTESHVLFGLEAVLGILDHLRQSNVQTPADQVHANDFAQGKTLLRTHTESLLGPRPAKRGVRIMVTMPSEAARDYQLVRQLLWHGMDCMRINCAHDDAAAWAGMVAHLRRAQQELERDCQILMDLGGPKLRTGPIDANTQVLKWSPQRDLYGRVKTPARIWLTPAEQPELPPTPAAGCLRVPGDWLASTRSGDGVRFTDLRSRSRLLEFGSAVGSSRWATSAQTVYLGCGTQVQLTHIPKAVRRAKEIVEAEVDPPPPSQQFITLKPGDTLIVTRAPLPGRPAVCDQRGHVLTPATISCTLPEVFQDLRPKEPIWFDDGKIGGVIEAADSETVRVQITTAAVTGDKLRPDKGINLPGSALRLPALTDTDIVDLDFVVRHADLVGLSFVKRPSDVHALQTQLAQRGADRLGIVLKIETRTGFEQLPSLLLAAMRGPRVGVMIARGDLAVECGWERLAEVQEEILWVCEAAHIPVIWATQVLESLAKKGVPSRAEITDAAMGERAECVMLNKGPHLVTAVRVLDDILRRMEAHQSKKSARLRPLRLSAMMPA
jgi:pyruvate kinase